MFSTKDDGAMVEREWREIRGGVARERAGQGFRGPPAKSVGSWTDGRRVRQGSIFLYLQLGRDVRVENH